MLSVFLCTRWKTVNVAFQYFLLENSLELPRSSWSLQYSRERLCLSRKLYRQCSVPSSWHDESVGSSSFTNVLSLHMWYFLRVVIVCFVVFVVIVFYCFLIHFIVLMVLLAVFVGQWTGKLVIIFACITLVVFFVIPPVHMCGWMHYVCPIHVSVPNLYWYIISWSV